MKNHLKICSFLSSQLSPVQPTCVMMMTMMMMMMRMITMMMMEEEYGGEDDDGNLAVALAQGTGAMT